MSFSSTSRFPGDGPGTCEKGNLLQYTLPLIPAARCPDRNLERITQLVHDKSR